MSDKLKLDSIKDVYFLFEDILESAVKCSETSVCVGKIPGEVNSYRLKNSGLESFHGLHSPRYSPWGCKSCIQLSDFTFHFCRCQ